MAFRTSKEIEIDAGHRVMTHGSQCAKIHGHRWKVRAEICGKLQKSGEESGMIKDFGFLKQSLMEHVHAPCDHGFIACVADTELLDYSLFEMFDNGTKPSEYFSTFLQALQDAGRVPYASYTNDFVKAYIIQEIPTAENLAKHWYQRLAGALGADPELDKAVRLIRVTVFETPSSQAIYSPWTYHVTNELCQDDSFATVESE